MPLIEWLREGVRKLFTKGSPQPSSAMPMHAWHLEAPDITRPPSDPARFEVRGWIVAASPVTAIRFADARLARLLPLTLSERPDVTASYGLPAHGFAAACEYDKVRDAGSLELLFTTGEGEFRIEVPAYRPVTDAAALKRAKLERVRPLLRCPKCGAEGFESAPASVRCGKCASTYPVTDARLDFLTPELRASFDIVPTENVSSNGYDGEALNLIYALRDGLILDCGAGLRDRCFGNVVNYEIVAYETTDVLGVGERLPFKDASFDAVFSFAVLEHVKDPFACSAEMLRVLKPGGTLYCQVPFLQPLHGYPHHYYNMTMAGMRNLFGDAIRVERSGPFLFGQPVFALSWILNRYLEGLPPGEREGFKSMRVEELLAPAGQSLGKAYVTALSPAAREELSCCNALIATKR